MLQLHRNRRSDTSHIASGAQTKNRLRDLLQIMGSIFKRTYHEPHNISSLPRCRGGTNSATTACSPDCYRSQRSISGPTITSVLLSRTSSADVTQLLFHKTAPSHHKRWQGDRKQQQAVINSGPAAHCSEKQNNPTCASLQRNDTTPNDDLRDTALESNGPPIYSQTTNT